jgi:hypothetical protein
VSYLIDPKLLLRRSERDEDDVRLGGSNASEHRVAHLRRIVDPHVGRVDPHDSELGQRLQHTVPGALADAPAPSEEVDPPSTLGRPLEQRQHEIRAGYFFGEPRAEHSRGPEERHPIDE